MTLRHAALAIATCAAAACTHTSTIRVDSPDAKVIVDGKDVGAPGPTGAPVELRRGAGPIPYEVHAADGAVAFGEIERTETAWWMLGLAGAGALCCAPSAAAAGFVIANPGLLGGVLGFAVFQDYGALTKSCSYPAWLTIPVMVACGTAGLSPLGLAFVAEEPAPDVTLVGPPPKEPAAAPVAMRF